MAACTIHRSEPKNRIQAEFGAAEEEQAAAPPNVDPAASQEARRSNNTSPSNDPQHRGLKRHVDPGSSDSVDRWDSDNTSPDSHYGPDGEPLSDEGTPSPTSPTDSDKLLDKVLLQGGEDTKNEDDGDESSEKASRLVANFPSFTLLDPSSASTTASETGSNNAKVKDVSDFAAVLSLSNSITNTNDNNSTNDTAANTTVYVRPSMDHLNMDEQRQQVYCYRHEKHQEFVAKHAAVQAMKPDDRAIATKLLLVEAQRSHRTARKRGYAHTTSVQFAKIKAALDAEFEDGAIASAQRSLSCMCIFSPVTASREYGENEEDRFRRYTNQQNVLVALNEQSAAAWENTSPSSMPNPSAGLFLKDGSTAQVDYFRRHDECALRDKSVTRR